MDRKTTIIDDTASLQLGNFQQTKGKGKAKKLVQNSNEASGGAVTLASQPTEVKKSKAPRKTKTAAAPSKQFYEKNGLKINLFEKGGRKRTHARLAHTLRKKSEDDLLAIVELYAGSAKSQEFKKNDIRKQDIAEWIEAKETLALGPHPQSTLVIAQEDEEEAESSSANQADEILEVIEPSRGKKRPSPEAEPSSQPPPKQQKRDQTPEPKPIAHPVKHASPAKNQAIGTRKPDGAKTPTHSQQTDKSPKKHSTPGPVTVSHITVPNNQDGTPSKKQKATTPRKRRTANPKKQNNSVPKDQNNTTPTARIDTPMSKAPEIPSSHSTAATKPDTTPQTEEAFMASINLDPSHPFTATKVIQLPAQLEHRILTAYQRDTAFAPPPSFHSTSIPHNYRADNNPRFQPPPPLFLSLECMG